MRTGALDAIERDIGVFREPPRQRRREDAIGRM
jgi:hypothetical protein